MKHTRTAMLGFVLGFAALNFLILWLAVWPRVARAEETEIRFSAELSKAAVYAGEQVTVTFVIHAPADVLEVEVAKFPEFRGFWSENLSLRQGPISLMPGGREPGMRSAIVGSYLLTPMTENENWTIIPMKLLVRIPDLIAGGRREVYLESKVTPFQVKPLPPIPEGKKDAVLLGGVGHFTLQFERTEVGFQTNEPTGVRVILLGGGNFPEITSLPIVFPDFVEVLSWRSFMNGTGTYAAKTFEVTLSVHNDQNFQIPPRESLYFNPDNQKWETLILPVMSFVHIIPTTNPDVREKWIPPAPYEEWTEYTPVLRQPVFIASNGALFLASGGTIVLRELRRRKKRRRNPRRENADRKREAVAHLEANNLGEFLRLAEDSVIEMLREMVPETTVDSGNRPVTRMDFLRRASKKLTAERIQAIDTLFTARDALLYSPEKSMSSPAPALRQNLETALKS